MFAPATDSVATTAAIQNLCGIRVYSIVESNASNFVSIAAPGAGQDPLIANWTLVYMSMNLGDVGIHTVTLKAVLQLYSSISAT